jgi:hypothetical protein
MDNLRITAITGVIVLHAATAYILDIDWYYEERTTSALTPALLGLPALLGALLGLGPLFLLAGLVAAASLHRKGPGGFARGRLLRLGLPLLLFLVLLDPLTDYLGSLAESQHPGLWPYLVDRTGTRDAGPLWFVAVLLLLSLAYAGLRGLRPARSGVVGGVGRWQLIAVAAAVAAGSFAVRLISPFAADTVSNLRWSQWPQAAGLFTLGVLVGERGGSEAVDRRWMRRCGRTAAAGALALMLLAVSAVMTDRLDAVAGGWTWQSATFAVLEGPAAVGFSLWALAWFRRRWDRQGLLTRWAGRGSYAAYVLHPPVLVLVSLGARPLPLVPEAKFVLVAAAGVAASFAVGAAASRPSGHGTGRASPSGVTGARST